MDADYAKKRLEKDLGELKRMIDDHFKQRQEDEAELSSLQDRIEKRKAMRAEQMAARIERERIQAEAAEAAKVAKAAEEEAKRKAAEEEKKAAMASLSMGAAFKNQGQKGKTSRVDRERKKKALQERRKPLNVDHLGQEKLLEKVAEMHAHLCQLEKEKVNADQQIATAQHIVQIARARVNVTMSKLSKKGMKKRT